MEKTMGLKRFALALGTSALLVGTAAVPVFAASSTPTDPTATSVTVDASISLDNVPATIAFGAGVPSDVKTPGDFDVTVTTNNDAGYKLTVATTNLTSVGATTSDFVPAAAVGYDLGDGVIAGATSATQLMSKASKSAADGDSINIVPSLTIPFVDSGDYAGTATFTASTL